MAVDFEKRELKDTQHKSDNGKQSYFINKIKICVASIDIRVSVDDMTRSENGVG